MKNKFILFGVMLLFSLMFVNVVSAGAFDTKSIYYETAFPVDTSDFLKTDFNSDYGLIRLSSTFLWIATDKLAEYTLTKNTDYCMFDCSSQGKVILYKDGMLFEDMNFFDVKNNMNPRELNYKIYLGNGYKEATREVCSDPTFDEKTGEILKESICSIETYQEPIFEEYNNKILSAGNYEWKLEGTKGRDEHIEWIATSFGKELSEWTDWESYYWVSNSTINNSLPTVTSNGANGGGSSETVFYKDSSWYLISGEGYGNFRGYVLAANGTTWLANSTIISGLTKVPDNSRPNAFKIGNNWYLISGEDEGIFSGWALAANGTTWISNSTIINGLGDIGYRSAPYVFYKDSSWYLISGASSGWHGFNWNGTQWLSNTTIKGGLPFVGNTNPTIFNTSLTNLYLISGQSDGTYIGYSWISGGWVSNSTIIAGLQDTGSQSKPNVFYKDSSWYMISGDADGKFYGYDFTPDITPPYFTTIPANVSMIYPNSSFLSKFVATDTRGFGYYSINDSKFIINQTGFLKNDSYLAVGNYNINVTINDTSNNIAWTIFTVQVNKSADSCSVYFNTSSPITFPSNFIAYHNCTTANTFTRNGTVITNGTTISGGVTAYNISVQRTDTTNYTNTFNQQQFIISKNPEICQVLFNETSPLVYSKPFKVWANCSSAFVLARNGTTIVNNSDQSLAVGAYNFSFSRNDTANYTIIFNQSQFIIANSTINSNTNNALGYETGTEKYYLNITSPVVPTNAYLFYDGFPFAATVTNIAGSFYNLSATIQINSSMIGANTFYYEWNLTSNYKENSTTYNQNIDPILFGLCNGTLTIPYLNFTFKDETTSDWINATIPTSTFIYYLGDGSVFKTLTYYQLTPKLNYTFCALPSNLTYYIDPSMQYDSGVNYIQRTYNPDVATYTNATTNTTLFLLGVGAGSSVTFQVVNILSQSVDGVLVNVVRIYGDSNETIGTGTTDSAGIVTFTLNQEYTHSITFSKTGYTTYTILIVPTQSLYTVTLSSTLSIGAKDYTRGIKTYLYPKNKELSNDTSTNFIFNVTSSYWDLDSFGFRLRLANGTIVGTASSTVEGTGATYVYNINNQTIIYMDYYWKIEGNYTNSSTYWIVTNTLNAGWSIKNLFIDLRLYLDSGMFGLNDFGRYMISFIILFLIVGLVGYKFGIQNTILMSATIFIVVFFLDVVVGLIPAVRGIENLVTYVAGLLLAVVTINEVVTR